MLYIDPKDQPAHPDWPATYAAAWNERKRLRLEHARVAADIQNLDAFLATYEKLEPTPKAPYNVPHGQSVTITAQTSPNAWQWGATVGKSEGQK